MRKNALAFVPVLLIVLTLAGSAALAAPVPQPDIRPARADATAAVLPPVAAPARSRSPVSLDELRDCAALVLVGGMLIGLAAAVRRTA